MVRDVHSYTLLEYVYYHSILKLCARQAFTSNRRPVLAVLSTLVFTGRRRTECLLESQQCFKTFLHYMFRCCIWSWFAPLFKPIILSRVKPHCLTSPTSQQFNREAFHVMEQKTSSNTSVSAKIHMKIMLQIHVSLWTSGFSFWAKIDKHTL